MEKTLVYRVGQGKWHLLGLGPEWIGEFPETCKRFSDVDISPAGDICVMLNGKSRRAETRWLPQETLAAWIDQGQVCKMCWAAERTTPRFGRVVTTANATGLGIRAVIEAKTEAKTGLVVRKMETQTCPRCQNHSTVLYIGVGGGQIVICRHCLQLLLEMVRHIPTGTEACLSSVSGEGELETV